MNKVLIWGDLSLDVLGLMGATGFSFGCHLHFGAYYQGSSFDPMNLYR